MYAPVSGAAVVPVASKGRGAWPLAAICCLGLLALLIVSTIVLALIPIYLPSKKVATTNSTTTANNFYVQYQATPTNAYNQPAGTVTNPAAIGALAGAGNNGVFTSGTATAAVTRRRRGVLDRRGKRDLKSNIFFLCQPIFGLTCFSTACRAATVTKLQQAIQQKGDIANAPLSVLANGTTQQFPLLLKFIGFLTTAPPGFGSSGSSTFNFTAQQSGVFNSPATWQGNIIPYGNASVFIPAGITVTIANSTLVVPVQLFDISGTLAVGAGASTFTFLYPTSIIIRPGGTFQDLTTSKSITLAQGSTYNAINGSNPPTGSSITTGAASTSKRQIGSIIQITTLSITIVVIETIVTFPRITPYCRRNGAFSSPFSYAGGFAPQDSICRIGGCGLKIPNGISLSTAELVGVMTIRIDIITIDVGGTFQVTSVGSGFRFLNAVQLDVSGTLGFSGSGNTISAIGGCTLNAFPTAIIVTSVTFTIQTIDVSGNVLGSTPSIGPGTTGPFFESVSATGTYQQSTGPLGIVSGSTAVTTAAPSSVVTTPFVG